MISTWILVLALIGSAIVAAENRVYWNNKDFTSDVWTLNEARKVGCCFKDPVSRAALRIFVTTPGLFSRKINLNAAFVSICKSRYSLISNLKISCTESQSGSFDLFSSRIYASRVA
jgi:hypothetical protein